MKKIFCSALLFLAFSQNTFPLLAPLSESIVEIRAILNSPELTGCLKSSDVIEEIKKTNSGYQVTTKQTQLFVELKNVPSKTPGPQQFHLKFIQTHEP